MDNSDANSYIETVDDSDCPISPSGKIGQTKVSQNSRSKSGKTGPKNSADIPSSSQQKRDSSSLLSDTGKKKKKKTKHTANPDSHAEMLAILKQLTENQATFMRSFAPATTPAINPPNQVVLLSPKNTELSNVLYSDPLLSSTAIGSIQHETHVDKNQGSYSGAGGNAGLGNIQEKDGTPNPAVLDNSHVTHQLTDTNPVAIANAQTGRPGTSAIESANPTSPRSAPYSVRGLAAPLSTNEVVNPRVYSLMAHEAGQQGRLLNMIQDEIGGPTTHTHPSPTVEARGQLPRDRYRARFDGHASCDTSREVLGQRSADASLPQTHGSEGDPTKAPGRRSVHSGSTPVPPSEWSVEGPPESSGEAEFDMPDEFTEACSEIAGEDPAPFLTRTRDLLDKYLPKLLPMRETNLGSGQASLLFPEKNKGTATPVLPSISQTYNKEAANIKRPARSMRLGFDETAMNSLFSAKKLSLTLQRSLSELPPTKAADSKRLDKGLQQLEKSARQALCVSAALSSLMVIQSNAQRLALSQRDIQEITDILVPLSGCLFKKAARSTLEITRYRQERIMNDLNIPKVEAENWMKDCPADSEWLFGGKFRDNLKTAAAEIKDLREFREQLTPAPKHNAGTRGRGQRQRNSPYERRFKPATQTQTTEPKQSFRSFRGRGRGSKPFPSRGSAGRGAKQQ